MQTTVETTEPHTVKLTIEVEADEFEKDLDRTYRAIANEIRIPGFRKGKAPKPIIDAQVGKDTVLDEFVHSSVPAYFRRAVSDEDLAPIGDPDVDIEQLEPGKAFVFTATVEVRPRLEFSEDDYSGIQVEKPAIEVTDEEVDEWVERLRQRFAELEPVDRPVQDGDFVTANISATQHGEPVEAVTRDEHIYAVGSAEFGDELDRQLPGTKPGDILKFDDTLPERFGEELTGGQTSFTVLVKDVKAVKLPDADDGFAKTASEFDTMDQLRDDLRERLAEIKDREAHGAVRDSVLQAMIDRVDVDLPGSLIDEETQHRVVHAEERAQRVGMSLDQMLELQGWDRERLAQDSRDHAIRAIKADLVLEAVARAAELEVTADEIGAEINALAQAYQREPKELAKQLDRTGQIVTLAGDIIRTKALDLLVDRADIQTQTAPVDGDAAASPQAQAADAEADGETDDDQPTDDASEE
ncbi:MAG TPA: trigger factor [Actinomycetota bacterium]|nr:trigger factor [Actinomycetota bacterium]